ncbi:hypothetical protein LIER_43923 [Lithospermum erythrorhizon]|uniref:Uncharacterized protein n=1 Tax=Lithospermum erythrorhizon TaxID=34254 RepID=A0AAV3R7B8_LITER
MQSPIIMNSYKSLTNLQQLLPFPSVPPYVGCNLNNRERPSNGRAKGKGKETGKGMGMRMGKPKENVWSVDNQTPKKPLKLKDKNKNSGNQRFRNSTKQSNLNIDFVSGPFLLEVQTFLQTRVIPIIYFLHL